LLYYFCWRTSSGCLGDDRRNAPGLLLLGLRGIEWANLGYEGPRKLCIS
jgi:hypothetical protein